MRILVLVNDYPSDERLYAGMYIHVRVAAYQRRGQEVKVVVFFRPKTVYEFDGVAVHCAPDLHSLVTLIKEFQPDVVAMHGAQGWYLRKLIEPLELRTVVWVHGSESQWWFRRLFDAAPTRAFLHHVKCNCIHMITLQRFVRRLAREPRRHRFVFVSHWMRRMTEMDMLTRIPECDVIANPIDPERFPFSAKPPEQRRRILLLRPFRSRKHATDLAIKAILLLSRYAAFKECEFSICGQGPLFGELTRPLRRFANVDIDEGFRTHQEIRALHASHGVFLCPTRQDAQGVSMCEAMCSGLVPVTSNCTAIPEFVTDGVSGFLTHSLSEIAAAILTLFDSPETFSRMSAAAADEVRRKAALDMVVGKELDVLRAAAASVPPHHTPLIGECTCCVSPTARGS
jgi:glycosyltransferase involved in cell wall biosynthesis